ncbi:MAG TPA: chemotaxis protein CheW [Anaeromyxobacteraceae bacterium]|nr:chemotaxis protein CheW [Anaeromyxobacteraceae bacterium]
MDFPENRRKAEERATAAAEGEAAPGRAGPVGPASPGADGPRSPAAAAALEVPPPDPVLTEEDVLAGTLAARLQGLPPAGEGEPERFWTWRPDSGPPVPAPPPSHPAFGAAALARPPATDPLAPFFYRPEEEGGALEELGAPADAGSALAAETGALEEFLAFRLGAEAFAVAIPSVREVVRAPPITEVPRAPAHVAGVVTVRGEVVAVFDPRSRLGLPAAAVEPAARRIVIVDGGVGSCGLLVDAVSHVVRLPPGSIEPCPSGVAGPNAELLVGVGRERGSLFTVLDVAALLAPAPGRSHA